MTIGCFLFTGGLKNFVVLILVDFHLGIKQPLLDFEQNLECPQKASYYKQYNLSQEAKGLTKRIIALLNLLDLWLELPSTALKGNRKSPFFLFRR